MTTVLILILLAVIVVLLQRGFRVADNLDAIKQFIIQNLSAIHADNTGLTLYFVDPDTQMAQGSLTIPVDWQKLVATEWKLDVERGK